MRRTSLPQIAAAAALVVAGTRCGPSRSNAASTAIFHFWGPGLNVNSPDQRWWEDEETGYYYGRGGGTVCVEAWEWVYPGSYWDSIGLPCLPT